VPQELGSMTRDRDGRDGAWALAIHGGAGDRDAEGVTEDREELIRAALSSVLADGARGLSSGRTSLDVVEDAVRNLEDSPLFNAGRGAVFNVRGEHELEASIMDGRTQCAGAVAIVSGVKNPVSLARLVMERTAHVFLQGEGAMEFAREQGVELMDQDYFWTAERWQALEKARQRAAMAPEKEFGTVGAVALDRHGNLAAATSTGGMTNKRVGRVGDSPIIGAGTYASNASCAVSCTGHGEYFIRATIARDVAAMIEYGGKDARAAAEAVISEKLAGLGGKGGVIVVDRDGNLACSFNSRRMYRGLVSSSRSMRVAV
jgi:beta-aspartyl-peptidase (threonine type)